MSNNNSINEKNDLKTNIGDNVHFLSVATDSFDNRVIVGYVCNRTGITEALIVKLNKDGNLLWQKRLGCVTHYYFNSIITDSSGDYIVVGREKGSVCNYEALIVKFDTNGNLLWRKRLGGNVHDYLNSVTTDSIGNYIAVGHENSNRGGDEALIVKFDTNGNLLWQKRLGGTSENIFRSVTTDSIGNYIAVGHENSNRGGDEALIVKFDTNGNLLWQKRLGGTSENIFRSVSIDSSNNYIAIGYELNSGGYYEALIVKFDTNGNLLWQKRLGGTSSDIFYSVATDSSGNYIAVGYELSSTSNAEALIAKFDTSGNLLWQERLGNGGEMFNSVTTDSSGNYIAVGYENSSNGTDEALIAKFDSTGKIVTEPL